MKRRDNGSGSLLPVALVALVFAACGAPEQKASPEPQAESAPAPASTMLDAATASGVYAMRGVTVQAADGQIREIGGTLRLHVKGESFSATFELATKFPGPGGTFPATVAGWGQGVVVGDTLAGTLSSSVFQTGGAGAPTGTGAKEESLVVMSSSVARFTPGGSLQIELQNHPGLGQEYSPSVTVLEGKRTGPLESDVASGGGPSAPG